MVAGIYIGVVVECLVAALAFSVVVEMYFEYFVGDTTVFLCCGWRLCRWIW